MVNKRTNQNVKCEGSRFKNFSFSSEESGATSTTIISCAVCGEQIRNEDKKKEDIQPRIWIPNMS